MSREFRPRRGRRSRSLAPKTWAFLPRRAAVATLEANGDRQVDERLEAEGVAVTQHALEAFDALADLDDRDDVVAALAHDARTILDRRKGWLFDASRESRPWAALDALTSLSSQLEYLSRRVSDPRLEQLARDLRECGYAMEDWIGLDESVAAITTLMVIAGPALAGLLTANGLAEPLSVPSAQPAYRTPVAHLLALLSIVLPPDERGSFVDEQLGSLAHAGWLESSTHLIDLIFTMPKTAWVFRIERRRRL